MKEQPTTPTVINRTVSMRLTEGMTVEAADGMFGELADLIIDPTRRRLTHLVVQPLHHHDQARLVPVDAVATSDDHVTLSWSTEEIRGTRPIEETDFSRVGHSPEPEQGWDAGNMHIVAWPYGGGMGLYMPFAAEYGGRSAMTTTTTDASTGSLSIRTTRSPM